VREHILCSRGCVELAPLPLSPRLSTAHRVTPGPWREGWGARGWRSSGAESHGAGLGAEQYKKANSCLKSLMIFMGPFQLEILYEMREGSCASRVLP